MTTTLLLCTALLLAARWWFRRRERLRLASAEVWQSGEHALRWQRILRQVDADCLELNRKIAFRTVTGQEPTR